MGALNWGTALGLTTEPTVVYVRGCGLIGTGSGEWSGEVVDWSRESSSRGSKAASPGLRTCLGWPGKPMAPSTSCSDGSTGRGMAGSGICVVSLEVWRTVLTSTVSFTFVDNVDAS